MNVSRMSNSDTHKNVNQPLSGNLSYRGVPFKPHVVPLPVEQAGSSMPVA